MLKEPQLSDFIYEEIRQCEKYALLNLITFEAAIRNAEVMRMLNYLNAITSEDQLDAIMDDDYKFMNRKKIFPKKLQSALQENFFLDYKTYAAYEQVKKAFLETYCDEKSLDPEYQDIVDEMQAEYDTNYKAPSVKEQVELYKKRHAYNVIVNHDLHTSHTHYLSLPLYRPKMHIPQKESTIHIDVPMYHIHPKDIKNYYESLAEKHLKVMVDATEYYRVEELFFDMVNDTKSKAGTYAEMFFVWDYVKWWEQENRTFTPDDTARMLYAEIAYDHISVTVDDKTGRSATVEKYMEVMKGLIDKCGYKQFYVPKNE